MWFQIVAGLLGYEAFLLKDGKSRRRERFDLWGLFPFSVLHSQGSSVSQLEKDIGSEQLPISERYFGFVNFGNTCYCNSVLQALYFCRPLRERILLYYTQQSKAKAQKDNMLTCLAELFHSIATQRKRVGSFPPKKFVQRLKKENELFDNYMQQDAHEFLNFLLNTVADLLVDEALEREREREREREQDPARSGKKPALSTSSSSNQPISNGSLNGLSVGSTSTSVNGTTRKPAPTWVHEIFQGTLTNETRCLTCETVSSKDEDFFDLSVDVEQNTSITNCLKGFSNTETLQSEHKYYCEVCCSKQEAQKRMRVKKAPQVLALHLKRFKYVEALQRYTKLSYRVVFPFELRLFNTVQLEGEETADRLYDLVAVVVHCGTGPNRGHYITIVKSHGFWLLFDDDVVDVSFSAL